MAEGDVGVVEGDVSVVEGGVGVAEGDVGVAERDVVAAHKVSGATKRRGHTSETVAEREHAGQ